MIKKFKQIQMIDEQLVKWIEQLDEVELHNEEEYKRILGVIDALQSQKDKIKGSGRESRVPVIFSDRVIASAIGLVGVLAALNYEREDVITGKAFGIAQNILEG